MTFLSGMLSGVASGYSAQEEWKDKAAKRQKDLADSAPTDKAVPAATGGDNLKVPSAVAGNASPLGLRDMLDNVEGGADYDTLFNYSNRDGGAFGGVKVSQMTIGDLSKFSDPSGAYGSYVKQSLADSGQEPRVATPMGRYQTVGTTLRGAAKNLGLSDDTVFDSKTQDRIFDHLASSRLSGAKTMSEKVSALRSEWDGLKKVDTADLIQAIHQFEKRGTAPSLSEAIG